MRADPVGAICFVWIVFTLAAYVWRPVAAVYGLVMVVGILALSCGYSWATKPRGDRR